MDFRASFVAARDRHRGFTSPVTRSSSKPGQELILSLRMRSDAEHPGVWNSDGVDFTVAGVVFSKSDVMQRFGEDVHGPLPRKTIIDLDTSGLTWTHKIAASNAVAVRLVVRDNATGRIGSITRSLP